jgi:hypothetical protein
MLVFGDAEETEHLALEFMRIAYERGFPIGAIAWPLFGFLVVYLWQRSRS